MYEGWDFLMRVAMVLGVKDICTPTATYRRWTNAFTSSNMIPEEEWEKDYQIVREKIRRSMLVLPSDYMPAVMGMPTEVYVPTKDPMQEKLLAEKDAALKEKDQQLQAKDGQIAALLASTSWKIGRWMTWLPRMLRGFRRVCRTQGLGTALRRAGGKVFRLGGRIKHRLQRNKGA